MRFARGILAFVALALTVPAALDAQNLSSCSVNAKNYVRTSYDLVNQAGDIIEQSYNVKLSDDLSVDYPYGKGRVTYGFLAKPQDMNRSGSLWAVGIGCALDSKTNVELSVTRSTSAGAVSGVIRSEEGLVRWWRSTWQSQPLPVINHESCSNVDGSWIENMPCASPIPYWSSDKYSSWNADALVARNIWKAGRLKLGAIVGLTLDRVQYRFVTGEKQFSRYWITEGLSVIVNGVKYPAIYRYENDIFLETTSISSATFVGPAFGLRLSREGKRVRFGATLRHDILRGTGSNSVQFIDIDDQHECFRHRDSGEPIACFDQYLDGSVNMGSSRTGFSSRTSGDLNVSLRLHRRLDLGGGLSVSHSNAYLTQQLVKLWGLGSNKAPDAMELSNLPRKGGDLSGFGFSGMYLGLTVRPF